MPSWCRPARSTPIDINADPALFVDAAFRSTGFDIRVGWGMADVELVSGTVLQTDSRVSADGAARLTLPSSVAATVQVPSGWQVLCYGVDHPACGQGGGPRSADPAPRQSDDLPAGAQRCRRAHR